jgi:predicted transcriptional regulator
VSEIDAKEAVGNLRWSTPSHKSGAKLRLGKINGEILEWLLADGSLSVADIASRLGYRHRDFRRRNLARMVKIGVVEVDGDIVHLSDGWRRVVDADQE